MMLRVSSSDDDLNLPTGAYVTEMPPWRSRPRTGAFPDRIVAPTAAMTTMIEATR